MTSTEIALRSAHLAADTAISRQLPAHTVRRDVSWSTVALIAVLLSPIYAVLVFLIIGAWTGPIPAQQGTGYCSAVGWIDTTYGDRVPLAEGCPR